MHCVVENQQSSNLRETKSFFKIRMKAPKELDLNLIKKSYSNEELRYSNNPTPPPNAPLPNNKKLWKNSPFPFSTPTRANVIRIKAYSV